MLKKIKIKLLIVLSLFFTTITLAPVVVAANNSTVIQEFQKQVVTEGKLLNGKVSYNLNGKWHDSGHGYSTRHLATECNGYVRRILVNAVFALESKGYDLPSSYQGLKIVTNGGLDLRGRLDNIQRELNMSTQNVPRKLTNSDYSPNAKEIDVYLNKVGAGAVVFFVKNKGTGHEAYHWGIYAGKENGKHMVFHNSTVGGGVYEEFNAMWFGKGSGYVFDKLYTPYLPIPELGTIQIEKVNADNKGIQGVTFDLYKSDKKTLYFSNLKTNLSGIINKQRIEPGTYYAKEVSTPSPYILNKDTWYRFDVKAGETAKVALTGGKIINEKATGIIEVKKKAEDNKLYAGVKYQIKNASGTVVDTITTGKNGVASSKKLPLGTYTVNEISAPKELLIDKQAKTVKLVYKDQNTSVVYSSVNQTNKYDQVLEVGIQKIRIDTKKASSGLTVETWLNIKQNYDFSLNNFGDSLLSLHLVNKDTGSLISTKKIKLKDLKENQNFDIPSRLLNKNTHANYEVFLEGDSSKVGILQERINTDGYTATESNIQKHVDEQSKFTFKEVIRTERIYGQNMVTYYEYFNLEVEPIAPLRTGYGIKYVAKTDYKNDLNNAANIQFNFKPDQKLIDKDYRRFMDVSKPFVLENINGDFVLPHVYAEIRDGSIIPAEEYNTLSTERKERYFDGGRQLLTPVWSTDPGKYNTQLKSNEIGVNAVQYTVDDYAYVYAFMFGWYDEHGQSPTHELDGIVAAPVMAHNPFPNGIPANWGFTMKGGKKALTGKEMEFFGQDPIMAVRYVIERRNDFEESHQVEPGSTVSVTDKIPSKPGHRFVGWKYKGKFINPGTLLIANEDLVFVAEWEVAEFKAEFDTNGGDSMDPIGFNWGENLSHIPAPTREGYDFMGWSHDLSQAFYNDVTIKALWRIKRVTVTFNSNGGTKIPSQELNWGDTLPSISDPTKVGYEFEGWDVELSKAIYSNTSINALWKDKYYDVFFDSNGGTEVPKQNVKHGQTLIVPTPPKKEGFTFKSWDGGNIKAPITNETTFTANYNEIKYTVTFDTGGGTKIPNQILSLNELIKPVDDPIRTGYDFDGWDYDFDEGVTDNLIVIAKWTPIGFLVEFDAFNDVDIPFQIVEYGKLAVPAETPIKEGYTFVKWDFDFKKPIYEDVLIEAIWEATEYEVHYNPNGGTGSMKNDIATYNQPFGAQKNQFTRTGYTFKDWNEKADGTGTKWTENPNGTWVWDYTQDITLYAQWEQNKYTVSFNLNGGTGKIADQTVYYGSKAKVPTNPSRPGYEFNGWSPNINNPITGNTTFVASWKSLPITNKYGYVQGNLSDGNLFQVYYTETYRGGIFEYITAEVVIQKTRASGSISGTANWNVTIAGNTFKGSKSYSIGNGSTGFNNLGWINVEVEDIKGSANYSVVGSVTTSSLGSVTTNTGYKPKSLLSLDSSLDTYIQRFNSNNICNISSVCIDE